MEKVLRGRVLKLYEDDRDILEDALIEIRQAIEMAGIYSSILSGTMDAYASVVSNNLNIIMKVLTVLTIIMTIPNIIFGFYGMNIGGEQHPRGFLLVDPAADLGRRVLFCVVHAQKEKPVLNRPAPYRRRRAGSPFWHLAKTGCCFLPPCYRAGRRFLMTGHRLSAISILTASNGTKGSTQAPSAAAAVASMTAQNHAVPKV